MKQAAYQVLARKWRPQLFAELAGLDHIGRTLRNAILRERVGHAFIFTGTRGVGKTSAARILAKALNCLERSPEAEPCNRCDNCLSVTAGNAADVIEIDGASNRGVAEIRRLRESVTYLPQTSPYKIYIIDEVHMLTPEAFNALLKTLEEPPAHVKFIMATTDAHKLPPTILSRCQRFDFGRLSEAVISDGLKGVGEREGLTFAPGTLELLAREARGSMRDALSLLDQARSYAGDELEISAIRTALGLIEAAHNRVLLAAMTAGDLAGLLTLAAELEGSGIDLKKFTEDFLFYLRDLLFLKISPDLASLVAIAEEERAELAEVLEANSPLYWQRLFLLFKRGLEGMKDSQTPRLDFENLMVEAAMLVDLQPLAPLLNRLDGYLAGSGEEMSAPRLRNSGAGLVEPGASPSNSSVTKPPLRPEKQPPAKPVAVAPLQSEKAAPAQPDGPASAQPQVTPAGKPDQPSARHEEKETAVAKQSGPSRPAAAASGMPENPEPPGIPGIDDQEIPDLDPDAPGSVCEPPPADLPAEESAIVGAGLVSLSKPVNKASKPVNKASKPVNIAAAPSVEKSEKFAAQTEASAGSSNRENNTAGRLAELPLSQAAAALETKSISSISTEDEHKALAAADGGQNRQWPSFIAYLEGRNGRLGSFLKDSQLMRAADGHHQLKVQAYVLGLLDHEGERRELERHWSDFSGGESLRNLEIAALAAKPAAAANGRRRSLPSKEEILKHPAVQFIGDRFGGRVTEIKPRRGR